MYIIQPDNSWATRFRIEKDGVVLGTIASSTWSTCYTITLPDEEVKLSTVKWYSSDVNILRNGENVGVTTNITFSFKPEIQIQYMGKLFRIQSRSMMSREYAILLDDGADGRQIGTVSKTGTFKTVYHVELPEFVEPWFVGVITALLIKQAAANAAAAS